MGALQRADDRLDPELVFVLIDEINNYFEGRSSSAAKKVAAFFKISLARLASATSARSRLFSASKSTDCSGRAAPPVLCLRTQVRSVSLLRRSSLATLVMAPLEVSGFDWAWSTSSIARVFSSSVYLIGKTEVFLFQFPCLY